jgi:glycosyltransferase involved in cell wall biosynthesis
VKKIKILINAYNEERNIETAILSVANHDIHVFDGVYEPYPHAKPYSTDKTEEICQKHGVTFHECVEAYESQEAKRTHMFSIVDNGEYCFVLDADEYITNPEVLQELDYDFDAGWVWSISNLYPKPYMKPRIFKKIEGMHYAGRHHWLYDGKNDFIVSDQNMGGKYKSKDTPIRIYNARYKIHNERNKKMIFLKERSKGENMYANERKVYRKHCNATPHIHRAGKIRRSFEVVKESVCEYSMTGMFSRPWAVKRYFDTFLNIEVPKETEYIALIDTKDQKFAMDVISHLDLIKSKFSAVRYYVTDNPPLPETNQVHLRRQRIVDNWDLIMPEVRGHTILATEDDSLPQKDACTRLLKRMHDENATFVQANIIGRWGTPMNPAWKIEGNPPDRVWTPKEKYKGFDEIQGVGWYCFVADTKACRHFAMSVNDDVLPFGPDLRFGHKLASAGYKLLHDWEVHVLHFGQDFELVVGKDQTMTLDLVKRNSKWTRR